MSCGDVGDGANRQTLAGDGTLAGPRFRARQWLRFPPALRHVTRTSRSACGCARHNKERSNGSASVYPPGPVLTLAAEMAEAHLDLALIAALGEQPSETLAWLYTGQAFHYLQDITNQIHTVQVGIYDFFVDATVAQLRWLSEGTGHADIRNKGSTAR